MVRYEILADYISRSKNTPFVWGENDCVLWVASFVREITGIDHASEIRDSYKSKRAAAKLLKDAGGLDAILSQRFDARQSIKLASRTDIILHSNQKSIGICSGQLSYFLGEGGVVSVPTLSCAKAWKV